jgi:hypothetical protein
MPIAVRVLLIVHNAWPCELGAQGNENCKKGVS